MEGYICTAFVYKWNSGLYTRHIPLHTCSIRDKIGFYAETQITFETVCSERLAPQHSTSWLLPNNNYMIIYFLCIISNSCLHVEYIISLFHLLTSIDILSTGLSYLILSCLFFFCYFLLWQRELQSC